MASGGLKITLKAAGTRLINKTSKVTPVCPKQGVIPYRAWLTILNKHGWTQNDLGGCWYEAYHFEHQKLLLYVCPKQGAIPYRSWPAIPDKHANNEQIPLCFISIDIYIYCVYCIYICVGYIYCIYSRRNTKHYNTVQYNTVQFDAIQYNTNNSNKIVIKFIIHN